MRQEWVRRACGAARGRAREVGRPRSGGGARRTQYGRCAFGLSSSRQPATCVETRGGVAARSSALQRAQRTRVSVASASQGEVRGARLAVHRAPTFAVRAGARQRDHQRLRLQVVSRARRTLVAQLALALLVLRLLLLLLLLLLLQEQQCSLVSAHVATRRLQPRRRRRFVVVGRAGLRAGAEVAHLRAAPAQGTREGGGPRAGLRSIRPPRASARGEAAPLVAGDVPDPPAGWQPPAGGSCVAASAGLSAFARTIADRASSRAARPSPGRRAARGGVAPPGARLRGAPRSGALSFHARFAG